MDEMDEQFRDSSREYEAEQPSLCESIAMGVVSSGLLTGSAPVNIPRTGLDRPCLTPSPPSMSLLSGIRLSGVDQHESANNSNSLFFNRVSASWRQLMRFSHSFLLVFFCFYNFHNRLAALVIPECRSTTGVIIKLVQVIAVEVYLIQM